MLKSTLLGLSTASLFLCVPFVHAQENTVATQTIQTAHLRGVESHSGFDVSLRQGSTSNAVITVDRLLQPYLRATISDGILSIGLDNLPPELQRKPLQRKADVTVTTLEKFSAHSGSAIRGEGQFTAPRECEIEVHSGALVKEISLTAQEVDVDVHSGARAVLSGTADRAVIATHSGAHADLSGLQSKTVQASASSGSAIKCCATNSIQGNASSGASIRYTGGATHVNTGSSSGGSVGPMK